MSSTLAAGLARKLKKVLDTRTDSPELLASLGALSAIYTANTPQARRCLRTTIEKRGLEINEEFLAASEGAQKALDAVESEVRELAECCERISKALNNCAATTGDMVVATERLKQELDNTTNRQELVANFLHNYQLTNDEMNALRQEDLDEKFFEALARVHQIHSNCKVLLRTHHQRAGLELMDVMAVYQEGAYERLCRWVQKECRNLGDNDIPEVSDLLRTAARSLRERPVLFNYCAEEVANSRHNALFRRFIAALTRGGPGGLPRPIEVHAHDPLRYVGDMLAWLHQAVATERELASALFSDITNDNANATSRRFSIQGSEWDDKSESASQTVAEGVSEKVGGNTTMGQESGMASVLDRVFEGVCRPFRVRVEQVLATQPTLLIVSKLSDLLAFYSHTIAELLGDGASLSMTVRELRDLARRTLLEMIKSRGEKLLRYPVPVAADLSPPTAVSDTMALIIELLDSYNTMMVPEGASKPDFEPILSALLEPLLEMCERAAEAYGSKGGAARSRMSPSSSREGLSSSNSNIAAASKKFLMQGKTSQQAIESLRKIFMVNCLSAILQPLEGQPAAEKRIDLLTQAMEAYMLKLVEEEVHSLLEKCKLATKLTLMKDLQGVESAPPFSSIPDLSFSSLSDSLRSFFSILAGSSDGSLPEFEYVHVPKLRAHACSRVAQALSDAYTFIYRCVSDPGNGYAEPKSLLRHTPEQMHTILGI